MCRRSIWQLGEVVFTALLRAGLPLSLIAYSDFFQAAGRPA